MAPLAIWPKYWDYPPNLHFSPSQDLDDTQDDLPASVACLAQLMGTARFIVAQTFRVYEPLLAGAVLYICLTFLITRAFRFLERYLNKDRLEPIQISTPLPIEVS